MRKENAIHIVFAPEDNPAASFYHDYSATAYPSFRTGDQVTLHCQLEDHREVPVPNDNFINRPWEKYEVVSVEYIFSQQNIIYDDNNGVILRNDTVKVIVKRR